MVKLDDVSLVISTFCGDQEVLSLLTTAFQGEGEFGSVIVVDSLGDPALVELIRKQFPKAQYYNASRNLGSAGNLSKRLDMAADTNANFAFALNHDGNLSKTKVAELARLGRELPRPGAVYPLRRYVGKGGALRRGSSKPLAGTASSPKTPETVTPTLWSSSNGALYALTPVREGITPRAELWMGWEDLGFGAALAKAGYDQVVANDVIVDDPYEFTQVRVGPFRRFISDKPVWYQYYTVRNLILLSRDDSSLRGATLKKLLVELGLVTFFRGRRVERYQLYARGLLDGVLGRGGKWRLP